MSSSSIAERLRDLRADKGLNQDVVSEACGISRIALARYETGARMPRAEYVARLADYYGVTVDYLMGREETPAVQNPNPLPPPESIPEYLARLTPENRAFIEEMAKKLLASQENK